MRASLRVQASGAPTPLRVRKKAKLPSSSPAPSSAAPVAPSLPRGPIDMLADALPDPILRAAVKEPIAFWGGVFAGVLRLSLDQDPLRTWVDRTSSQARAATGQLPPPQ
ncbi:hypothetical protein TSOC_011937 [Tetrabaena socialis]|uniref:Uncharacterized protein n=1 Tax=Tetrabaena socialis TaxID=47790 RepID=A0A2J7ZPB3_9CHLO|nr:hypothetical protein TSOC_011937 [Tetrabaena socialis]|eukprot:PNH02109.1 hypothetical protein TSOC_011937 [Tetrabaena socialis]